MASVQVMFQADGSYVCVHCGDAAHKSFLDGHAAPWNALGHQLLE